jgi:lipoprotein signal peptidase
MKAAYLKPFLVAAFIVLIDQVIKTWVRTHMDLIPRSISWGSMACCAIPKITAWPLAGN